MSVSCIPDHYHQNPLRVGAGPFLRLSPVGLALRALSRGLRVGCLAGLTWYSLKDEGHD